MQNKKAFRTSNFSSIVPALFSPVIFFFMVPRTPAKPIVQLHPIPPHHGDDLQPLSRPGPLYFLLLFASPGNFLFMSGPASCSPNGPYQGPSLTAWPALLWMGANALKQWENWICGWAVSAITQFGENSWCGVINTLRQDRLNNIGKKKITLNYYCYYYYYYP